MSNRFLSNRKLKSLNQRQRKKRHVGEFREFVFEVRMTLCQPLEAAAYDVLLDAFIELIESRQLAVVGLGGRLPLVDTDGIVSAWGRGSPTEDDRQAVLVWLKSRSELTHAEVGQLVDGWYGW